MNLNKLTTSSTTTTSSSSSKTVTNNSISSSITNLSQASTTKVQQKVPTSLPRPPSQNQHQLKQKSSSSNSSNDPNVAVTEDGTVFKINLSKRLPGRAQLSQTTSSSTIGNSRRSNNQRKLSGAKIVLSK